MGLFFYETSTDRCGYRLGSGPSRASAACVSAGGDHCRATVPGLRGQEFRIDPFPACSLAAAGTNELMISPGLVVSVNFLKEHFFIFEILNID